MSRPHHRMGEMVMTPYPLLIFVFILTSASVQSKPFSVLTSPYLSPSTIFPNYQNMLQNFKIFIYKPARDLSFTTPAESLFHASLLNSPFLTQNPNEAHLFFVPFPSSLSPRSISRLIRDLRVDFPYWNRTLGADHFYVSCSGIGYESDRNLVELKKNAVQISCFPTPEGKFIPHKDITLPPINPSPLPLSRLPNNKTDKTARFLGYYRRKGRDRVRSILLDELRENPEFVIEYEPSDALTYEERLANSKFCLFFYGSDDGAGIGDALRVGCVPVVITDRPIRDLPFADVLKWQEIAVFVGRDNGAAGLRKVLAAGGERRMRALGMTASRHFVWKESPEPYDSFHTVLYQLWLRRHTIRYARRELTYGDVARAPAVY